MRWQPSLRALENAAGIETDLQVEGDLSGLTDSQKIVLFRVVQEALSNVRKHSEAGQVSVVLRSRRTFVDVTVTDNGCGFDPRRLDAERLGLAGISERVRLLGGAVEIETSPGIGTTVRATLPQWRPSHPRPLRSTLLVRESSGPLRFSSSRRGRIFCCGPLADPRSGRRYRNDHHRHHGHNDDLRRPPRRPPLPGRSRRTPSCRRSRRPVGWSSTPFRFAWRRIRMRA